jgi:hypothetical protein
MSETALDRIVGAEETRAIWQALERRLGELGPYEVEAKKTSLHVTRGRAFLGVHPRKGALLLNIVTAEPIESPRIKKRERVSANRVHNEVLVQSPADLDEELVGWIRAAYELAGP